MSREELETASSKFMITRTLSWQLGGSCRRFRRRPSARAPAGVRSNTANRSGARAAKRWPILPVRRERPAARPGPAPRSRSSSRAPSGPSSRSNRSSVDVHDGQRRRGCGSRDPAARARAGGYAAASEADDDQNHHTQNAPPGPGGRDLVDHDQCRQHVAEAISTRGSGSSPAWSIGDHRAGRTEIRQARPFGRSHPCRDSGDRRGEASGGNPQLSASRSGTPVPPAADGARRRARARRAPHSESVRRARVRSAEHLELQRRGGRQRGEQRRPVVCALATDMRNMSRAVDDEEPRGVAAAAPGDDAAHGRPEQQPAKTIAPRSAGSGSRVGRRASAAPSPRARTRSGRTDATSSPAMTTLIRGSPAAAARSSYRRR